MSDRLDINVVIIGTVSAGKTTLLNSLFVANYGKAKIKRTTMVPQVYHETINENNDTSNVETISEQNKKINDHIIRKNDNNESLTLDDIKELRHFVPKLHDLVKLKRGVTLTIYDTPGMNDSRTKTVYYQYIHNNFHKFDIIIFLIDINSAMNTSDEVDILECIIKNAKECYDKFNKQTKMIVLLNKCDEMYFNDDDELVLDEDFQEMQNQAIKIINDTIKQCYPDMSHCILPISCEDAYIYRMLDRDPACKLDIKYVNKFGYNEYGKSRWNKLKESQKYRKMKYVLKKQNYGERMKLSGFKYFKDQLRKWLLVSEQYKLLSNHIKFSIHEINNPNKLDIIDDINKFHEIYSKIKRIDKLFRQKSTSDIMIYFTDYLEKFVKNYENKNIDRIKMKIQLDNVSQYIVIKKCYMMIQKLFVGLNSMCVNVIDFLNEVISTHYLNQFHDNQTIYTCLDIIDKLIENNYEHYMNYIHQLVTTNNNLFKLSNKSQFDKIKFIFIKYGIYRDNQIDLIKHFLVAKYKMIFDNKIMTTQYACHSVYTFWNKIDADLELNFWAFKNCIKYLQGSENYGSIKDPNTLVIEQELVKLINFEASVTYSNTKSKDSEDSEHLHDSWYSPKKLTKFTNNNSIKCTNNNSEDSKEISEDTQSNDESSDHELSDDLDKELFNESIFITNDSSKDKSSSWSNSIKSSS